MHKCARTVDGSVWCWGLNVTGQIGDGTTDRRDLPVKVTLPNGSGTFVDISAGGFSTCARAQGGSVWCWGANESGQVGDGTLQNSRPSPVQVTSVDISQVAEVIPAGDHSCALMSNGSLRCWGSNIEGRLGDGTTEQGPKLASVEVAVLGTSVVRSSGVCAIKSDSTLWCWGSNAWGQVGDGMTTNRTSPGEVTRLGSGVVEVSATFLRTCARNKTGASGAGGAVAMVGSAMGPSTASPA